MMINRLLCKCYQPDAEKWLAATPYITQYLAAQVYEVIVPDEEVEYFEAIASHPWQVVPESRYLPAPFGKAWVAEFLDPSVRYRAGWYWQQLVKIAALARGEDSDLNVIWEGDVIPLRPIEFEGEDGKIIYFVDPFESTRQRCDYQDSIDRLLTLPINFRHSFIFPGFPMRSLWVRELLAKIEENSNQNWQVSIMKSVTNTSPIGFSEVQLLGNYVYNFKDIQIAIQLMNWLRLGTEFLQRVNNISADFDRYAKAFACISFEEWTGKFTIDSVEQVRMIEFIYQFSKIYPQATIIQIGANQVVKDDFLHDVLMIEDFNSTVLLIEPIAFYADQLRADYGHRSQVKIMQLACGASHQTRILYSIPPEIADHMDGDGPTNGWAHGSGSFDRETIVRGIHANEFRGAEYRAAIPIFLESIIESEVEVVPLSSIPESKNHESLFLIIDVQGAEMEVLAGIDCNHPPKYILIEDDQGQDHSRAMADFFKSHNYRYIMGNWNRLYEFMGNIDS
ncbi:MAG: DUF6492 family protein [Candidatus Pacebacteria bacterium]|nr:DUF6492 family protein [Candidatus Paceibacterota bacterium]